MSIPCSSLTDGGSGLVGSDAEGPEDAGAGDLAENAGDEPRDAGHRHGGHKKTNGRLRVITTHGGESWWAVVSVDGVEKGKTPLMIDLPVGAHRIRVARTGFQTEERAIKVDSGREVALTISLRQ